MFSRWLNKSYLNSNLQMDLQLIFYEKYESFREKEI